jgi:CHAT domain-containing protein/tetratricopeptide (TPR) repeat protein
VTADDQLDRFQLDIAGSRAAGDVAKEIGVWLNIGSLYQYQSGDTLRAVAAYQQARELARAHGDIDLEILALTSVHFLFARNDEYDRDLDVLHKLVDLTEPINADRRRLRLIVLDSIAGLYLRLDNPRKALEYYQLALALLGPIGQPKNAGVNPISEVQSAVEIRFGFAHAQEVLGNLDGAQEAYAEVLAILNQSAFDSTMFLDLKGEALTNLARLDARRGDLAKAIDRYTQAIEDSRRRAISENRTAGSSVPVFYNMVGLAELLLQAGDQAGARTRFEEALQEYSSSSIGFESSFFLARVGFSLARAGDRPRAQQLLNRALEVEARSGGRLSAYMLQMLMQYWVNGQNDPLSIFYGKQAVNAFQRDRTRIRTFDQETRERYVESKSHVYRDLADLLIRNGRLPEAEQVLKLLKEDEYFEFLRRAENGVGGTVEPNAIEREWEVRYRAVSDRVMALGKERGDLMAKRNRSPAEEARLTTVDADLGVANETFQRSLDQLAAESRASGAGTERVFQLRESQGLMGTLRDLGRTTVAVYTLVGGEKYRAILVTADVQKAFEYPIAAADLNRKVLAFRTVLQDPRQDPRPLARELYDVLVGPMAKDLRDAHAERIMWSLDGVLRYLPVAALYDGKDYLVARYQQVVFTPASESRLKDAPAARLTAIGLGVSKARGDFPALPGVVDELRDIIRDRETFGRSAGLVPGRVLLDDAFTESAMKGALRQQYPIVHIASHFQFHPGNELESFLLLGDGQHLSLADLKRAPNLFAGVDLLTLSACDTATGSPAANGAEVEGFAVLAQRQGAKAVVATLWPVADTSTQRLMREFYRLRTNGHRSKGEALRQAQLKVLHDLGSGTAHPYFWAPFLLIGNWQ